MGVEKYLILKTTTRRNNNNIQKLYKIMIYTSVSRQLGWADANNMDFLMQLNSPVHKKLSRIIYIPSYALFVYAY